MVEQSTPFEADRANLDRLVSFPDCSEAGSLPPMIDDLGGAGDDFVANVRAIKYLLENGERTLHASGRIQFKGASIGGTNPIASVLIASGMDLVTTSASVGFGSATVTLTGPLSTTAFPSNGGFVTFHAPVANVTPFDVEPGDTYLIKYTSVDHSSGVLSGCTWLTGLAATSVFSGQIGIAGRASYGWGITDIGGAVPPAGILNLGGAKVYMDETTFFRSEFALGSTAIGQNTHATSEVTSLTITWQVVNTTNHVLGTLGL